MMMLLRPLKQLSNVNSDLQRGISAAQSIFLVLDEEVEKESFDKKSSKAANVSLLELISSESKRSSRVVSASDGDFFSPPLEMESDTR